MGEVKELNKAVTSEQAQEMAEKATAEVLAQMNGEARPDKLVFYRGKDRMWRWTRTAPNGETIGASTEGYERFKFALANFNRLTVQKIDLDVEVDDDEVPPKEAA